MKEIKMLAKMIREELEDAERYAKCCVKHKEDDSQLADMFYKLANEELNHATMEHEQAVRLIKSSTEKAPESMMAVWEWEHEGYIEKTADIKTLLSMYR